MGFVLHWNHFISPFASKLKPALSHQMVSHTYQTRYVCTCALCPSSLSLAFTFPSCLPTCTALEDIGYTTAVCCKFVLLRVRESNWVSFCVCVYLSYFFPSGFHTRDHNSRLLFPSSLHPLPPSSNSSTSILLFHPSLLEELKSAVDVDDCLQRSPVGNYDGMYLALPTWWSYSVVWNRSTGIYPSGTRMTNNPEISSRNRHFVMRMWCLRDMVDCRQLSFTYVPTDVQLADIFTKVLTKPRFLYLRDIIMSDKT